MGSIYNNKNDSRMIEDRKKETRKTKKRGLLRPRYPKLPCRLQTEHSIVRSFMSLIGQTFFTNVSSNRLSATAEMR